MAFSSQDKGKGPATERDLAPSAPSSPLPSFMTVGSGPGSEYVAQLQQELEADSGYGGSSLAGDEQTPSFWPGPGLANPGEMGPSDANIFYQTWYNKHRNTLARSITSVVELLKTLQDMNGTWPAHYPAVTAPAASTTYASDDLDITSPQARPNPLRRAQTSLAPAPHHPSSSDDGEPAAATPAPRLVSPQLAKEFSVLKLDLKLGSLHHADLVHSLEKGSIASLLDGKISSSIKHLLSLRDRIQDTSSKVLITGDLNAGKSTFCNALLRRKVLPVDQQPCTSIFCEVLDARENMGVEEVHAIHRDAVYDRRDESTYDVYPLTDLETLVLDNERYLQCKVYVHDVRRVDESLLNNKVVDIALIDAPGLNSDTTKTTAVFARQEEIDVVVFVVSAANHFTMTAQEFIWTAAAEKAYLFIVVNGFDMIRDKDRCKQKIMKQISGMSPQTHKEASELIHFVSSNAVPTVAGPSTEHHGGNGGGGGSGGGGDGDGDDPKQEFNVDDPSDEFRNLEQSLRRFVLEKRARSKLAPARTYLLNILTDVQALAQVNVDVARAEGERVRRELEQLVPQLETSQRATQEVSEQVEKTMEATCQEVYDHTRATLNDAVAHAGSFTQEVQYPGLLHVFQYAESLKTVMLAHISEAVVFCEDHARNRTVDGVNMIKQLGVLHLGPDYAGLQFRSDVMFRRRRDALARQIAVSTEVWDFVDLSVVLHQQEKVAGTGMALTLATAVGSRFLGLQTWVDSALGVVRLVGRERVRQMVVPGLVVGCVALVGLVLHQVPHTLPHRLAAKMARQLAALDYVHANATRISTSVRRVLRIPADNLRVSLEQTTQGLAQRREQTEKMRSESDVARKYFANLVRDTETQKALVAGVDLDHA